ncbi:MAG: hypothetical protein A9Z00_02285 [Thermobacillus sp. ZCTH02-B1]|nr:MAG: hypothetical protein A9Z00_02285 [Thermobacillus sp. ZCTH02-B1]
MRQLLQSRLSRRDLLREIGSVARLTKEHFARESEIEEKYARDYERNGLKNLVLRNKPPKKVRPGRPICLPWCGPVLPVRAINSLRDR